jgi:hypothetical protein
VLATLCVCVCVCVCIYLPSGFCCVCVSFSKTMSVNKNAVSRTVGSNLPKQNERGHAMKTRSGECLMCMRNTVLYSAVYMYLQSCNQFTSVTLPVLLHNPRAHKTPILPLLPQSSLNSPAQYYSSTTDRTHTLSHISHSTPKSSAWLTCCC